MKLNINQVVGYVAPPAKPGEPVRVIKGVVLEKYEDGTARLDVTPRNADFTAAADEEKAPLGHHVAIAAFNRDKQTENTFHLLEETAPAASKTQPAAAAPATSNK